MAGGIFISYRRDDAAHVAGRMADALAARVGRERVFVDVDSVAPGEDFVRKIETTIRESDLFLAVIGSNWLSAQGPSGQRRIDGAGDFIRLEVKSALASGMRIIPVLVDGASMPRAEDLPEDVRPLVRHNAVFINHATFARDMNALLEQLDLSAAKGGRNALNVLAMPVGALAVVLAMAAIALWPKGPSGPAGLTSSLSLDEPANVGERWITHTQFKSERDAGGRLSIRAELPYRDRLIQEKRIDGLPAAGAPPFSSPMPTLKVQVTNSTDKPIVISEVQFDVVKAEPDLSVLPFLRENAWGYHRVQMINEGWGELEAARLTVRAWGRPEENVQRARRTWKASIVTLQPCAEPSGLIEIEPVVVEGQVDGNQTSFDLGGVFPKGFDGAAFVCAIGELSYTSAGKIESLAVRTRVSNREGPILASPATMFYDLYLDPDREGYVAVVPALLEVAAGVTATVAVRIFTDKSADFQLRQSVRTAAGEIIPGEALDLQIFYSRNGVEGWTLDRARLVLIPPSLVAAVDTAGLVSSATYDPTGVSPAFFTLREDPAALACEAFLKDVAPRILDSIGMPPKDIEVHGPSGRACATQL